MAEEVIKSMQNIKGEAQAMYDEETLRWCSNYTNELREMQLRKFDEVTAKFMEYMEKYIKLSDEEIARQKAEGVKKTGQKGDPTKKPKVNETRKQEDIMFGIFVNVNGATISFDP